MPIYDVTITPDPSCSQEYRIEANNLEDAKDAALDLLVTNHLSSLEFEVEGEESDDQESGVDFSTKDE